MEHSLSGRQTQKLIITPELRQAITILQMPSLELFTYIEQQLQENPFLEICEEEEKDQDNLLDEVQFEKEEYSLKYNLDWEEYFQDSSDLGIPRFEGREQLHDYGYENFVARVPTLAEHLLFQLNLNCYNEKDRLIGEYLIGNIDQNGYLQVSIAEVATQVKVPPDRVANMLEIIQSFGPPGVAARSLEECLLIQIKHLGVENKLLVKMIKNNLVDLAQGKLNKIASQLRISVAEVQQMADIIKTLGPKPGCNFSNQNEIRYVVPDIILEKVDNDYIILVNDINLPRLMINSIYRKLLNREESYDPKTKQFMESKLNAAIWLISSIEQRRVTLYNVARCLVELQKDFLDHGVQYLKPLNLEKVAEMVGLHKSTVSRATSNKYIQTPQGVFEMKYFFSSGVNSLSGPMVSAERIKKELREVIMEEDQKNPLTDQKISEIFREKGIKISRRTVAKYRDGLGILPVKKRRRY